jgi:hypothetical protein
MNKSYVLTGIFTLVLAALTGFGLKNISNAVKKQEEIKMSDIKLPSTPEIVISETDHSTVITTIFINKLGIENWLAKAGIDSIPKNNKVIVCSGYGCMFKTKTKITESLYNEVKLILEKSSNPQEERENISRAINIIKADIGKKTGTDEDTPGEPFLGNGNIHQMSVFDETINTAQYLYLLADNGYIQFHNIESPDTGSYYMSTVNKIVDISTKKSYIVSYDDKGSCIIVSDQN